MNTLERVVYDLVKRNPKVKFALRDAYQSLCDIVPVTAMQSVYPIIARQKYFFGFHDTCPFSSDDSKLAAGRFTIPLRMPEPQDSLTVGYFDGEDWKDFHPVAQTRAWNWHQGCRLQWRGLLDELVFNDYDGRRNVARVVEVKSGRTRTLPRAVCHVSPDGMWGVGYSFERVQRYMPGYGYGRGEAPAIDHPAPETDGLYNIDLETGESRLIVTVAQMAATDVEPEMVDARHYLSHCIVSPGSKRIMFLHRWIRHDVRQRWSRMFTCDPDGGNLYRFPTREMVSHMGWRDANHILAYCRTEDMRDGYVLFEDGKIESLERIGDQQFNSDGHPSFAPGGRWIVTDTYPDRTRLQTLVLFDTATNKRYDLARLKQPKAFATVDPYSHWACDLHPRWNRSGTMVCFDATYTGERSLCTLDLKTLEVPPRSLRVVE